MRGIEESQTWKIALEPEKEKFESKWKFLKKHLGNYFIFYIFGNIYSLVLNS